MRKFTGNRLLIGSGSHYKVSQLGRYLNEHVPGLELVSPIELGIPSPPEIGDTFEENCETKAKYYGDKTGLISISDDSGLCVDELKGAPGVYTADWAVNGDFAPAIARLARELDAHPGKNYHASMVSVVSIYWPEHEEMYTFRGETDGYVNFDHIDTRAIGFQSVFYGHPFDVPFSALNDNQHKTVNARARSLKKLLDACF